MEGYAVLCVVFTFVSLSVWPATSGIKMATRLIFHPCVLLFYTHLIYVNTMILPISTRIERITVETSF